MNIETRSDRTLPEHGEDTKVLLEIMQAVNSLQPLDDVLEHVMPRIIGLLRAERGLVLLLDDNAGLQSMASSNVHLEQVDSIISRVLCAGEPVLAPDSLANNKHVRQKPALESCHFPAVCVPIIEGDRVAGAIYVDRAERGSRFSEVDIHLLQLCAHMICCKLNREHERNSPKESQECSNTVIQSSGLVPQKRTEASVTHELNNCLTIISNNAELMSMSLRHGKHEKLQHCIDSITRAVTKVKQLTEFPVDSSLSDSR